MSARLIINSQGATIMNEFESIQFDLLSDKLSDTIDEAKEGMKALMSREILFPGWDTEGIYAPEDESITVGKRIRDAAKAILAEGKSCDEGSKVPLEAVIDLVSYIASMLEQ